jgi:dockerin type I repeat protein
LAWWTSPAQLIAGDYDLSGTVDAADYDIWRANFGTSTDSSPLVRGDGNGDGRVDAADYIVWRRHFGAASPLAATARHAAVPECSTLLLVLLACACIVGRGRCR